MCLIAPCANKSKCFVIVATWRVAQKGALPRQCCHRMWYNKCNREQAFFKESRVEQAELPATCSRSNQSAAAVPALAAVAVAVAVVSAADA